MPRFVNVREHARRIARGGRTLVSRHKRKIAAGIAMGTIVGAAGTVYAFRRAMGRRGVSMDDLSKLRGINLNEKTKELLEKRHSVAQIDKMSYRELASKYLDIYAELVKKHR